jgi:hypothetical protein
MAKQEIPARWDVEVRVVTPDHQVLTCRQTYSSDYMDKSLMEYLFHDMGCQITKSIGERGYFN